MTSKKISQSIIDHYYLKKELNINTAAALWSENTPPTTWSGDVHGEADKFSDREGFLTILKQLSQAVAEYKLAESGFTQKEDILETDKEKSKNQVEKYIKPSSFTKSSKPMIFANRECLEKFIGFWPCTYRTTITREELARYALVTDQNPLFLKKDIAELKPFRETVDKLPPYLDPNHEFHSDELRIAIEAWLYFFDEGNYDPYKTPIEQIRKYLDDKCTSEMRQKRTGNSNYLSGYGKGRIATLINPKKGGGATKTQT